MKAEYDFTRAKRGAPRPAPKGKTRITIRIDGDVIDWFKKQAHDAGGGSYQTMLNEALRKHIRQEDEPLEPVLRRVIREELGKVRSRQPKRAA
jgi:hypothetical protein